MDIVRISSKGQIVIPAGIRRKMDLNTGDRLIVGIKGDTLILRPIVKLSKLKGIDKMKNLSEEVDKLREEWDEEWEDEIPL